MRFFTETFTAGETKQFAVRGGYLKIFSSTYNVNVNFYSASGYGSPKKIATAVPAGFSYKPTDEEFSGVSIVSAQAQVVTFIIANGDTALDRIIGEVSVVDGGKFRTLANQAFLGVAGQSAVVGQYALVQLWNPAASGKNLMVNALDIMSSSAGAPYTKMYGTALATLGLNPPSKKSGGAASVAELRLDSMVTPPGAGTPYMATYIQALTTLQKKIEEPIVVTPGYGLLTWGGGTNADLLVNYEFWEEAVT